MQSLGAVVIDLTVPEAKLSPYAKLPESLGVSHCCTADFLNLPGIGKQPEKAVVLQHLPTNAYRGGDRVKVALDIRKAGTRVTNVLFADHVQSFFSHGIVPNATDDDWEIVSSYLVSHPTFQFALVLRPFADDFDQQPPQTRRVLRAVNEYRFQKWFCGRLRSKRPRIDTRLQCTSNRKPAMIASTRTSES